MSSSLKNYFRTCLKLHQSWSRLPPRMLATPHRKYTDLPLAHPQPPLVKKLVYTNQVYLPIGPYSQAVRAGRMLYISGMLGADEMGTLDGGGVRAQTRRALCNLARVLEADGTDLRSVVKTTVLLADINDFREVNETYEEYFEWFYPARATYQVARLPRGASIEIDAIAIAGRMVVEQMIEPY